MDLVSLLITFLLLAVIFWLAAYIIKKTMPGELQNVAMLVLGVIALLVLVGVVTGYVAIPRVWVPR